VRKHEAVNSKCRLRAKEIFLSDWAQGILARFELTTNALSCDVQFQVVEPIIVYLLAIDDHPLVLFGDSTDKKACGCNILESVALVGWL
jgi:hypothetical protein